MKAIKEVVWTYYIHIVKGNVTHMNSINKKKKKKKKRNATDNDNNNNAFSILLNKSKKRKSNSNNKNIPQRKYGECPICSASIPLIALQDHVNRVHFSVTSSNKKRENPNNCNNNNNNNNNENNNNKIIATSSSSSSSTTTTTNNNKKNNAFNTMMENAKKKRRSEVFYLNFSNDLNQISKIDMKAACIWLDKNDVEYVELKKKEGANFKKPKCKLNDKTLMKEGIFLLETNIQSASKFIPSTYCNKAISISVIKSALQKNIRRCRPEQAVRCALQLINISFTDFIRRIPIIILEDAILHPHIHILIWFMVADSKDFIINNTHIRFFLQIVWEIAKGNCRDPFPPDEDFSTEREDLVKNFGTMQIEENLKSNYHKTIIRSILCRIRFGGMRGDMWMLRHYAYIWYLRFLNDENGINANNDDKNAVSSISKVFSRSNNGTQYMHTTWYELIENIYLKNSVHLIALQKLQVRIVDIPLSGVDFHCIPKMIQETCNYYRLKMGNNNSILVGGSSSSSSSNNNNNNNIIDNEKLEDIVKESIWKFSSSVNHKFCLYSGNTLQSGTKEERLKLLNIYKVCQKFIVQFQQEYLNNRF